jgi:hypothetical protein
MSFISKNVNFAKKEQPIWEESLAKCLDVDNTC